MFLDLELGGIVATITINKWDDFQPRKDRASHTWLRLNNDVIFSESLDGLTPDQKWFWICLLAYASRKQAASFDFNVPYFQKHFCITEAKMISALEILEKNGTITFDRGDAQTPQDTSGDAQTPQDTKRLTTDRQTDSTNKQTNIIPNGTITFDRGDAQTPQDTSGDAQTPQDTKRLTTDRQTDSTNKQTNIIPIGVKNLFDLWNGSRKTLPKCMSLTEERIRKARVQLEKYPDPGYWNDAMTKFASSDFCLNEWRPGFDDFLNEAKRTKALEGKYDNTTKQPQNGRRPPTAEEIMRSMQGGPDDAA